METTAKERVEKAIRVLNSCDRRWMTNKLRARIITLVERVSHRIEEYERPRAGNPKAIDDLTSEELHETVLALQYSITAMTTFQVAASIHFNIHRQTSRSGRPYFGVMPRPFKWHPKASKEPIASLDTEPYTHPIITTDLSKLGKRRLYSRIRAAVWREVERLERDEERAWRMLTKPTTPSTDPTP